ncbi:MAG: antitoxin family protein [Planctomycetota bacterium]|nr:antitoxin family protein [Planctomycetota bacterium]
MKQTLDAVYENGVFRPLSTPRIEDGQPVHLELETQLDGQGCVDARESQDAQPAWLTPILQRLSALLQLPPGWGSYAACAVAWPSTCMRLIQRSTR